jgi:hypothetical protein
VAVLAIEDVGVGRARDLLASGSKTSRDNQNILEVIINILDPDGIARLHMLNEDSRSSKEEAGRTEKVAVTLKAITAVHDILFDMMTGEVSVIQRFKKPSNLHEVGSDEVLGAVIHLTEERSLKANHVAERVDLGLEMSPDSSELLSAEGRLNEGRIRSSLSSHGDRSLTMFVV